MVFPKFMKDFYTVYPTSQITYFPNLFQLIESRIVSNNSNDVLLKLMNERNL